MALITPPLQFDHKPGFEIETGDKKAIRELYGFAKISIPALMDRYKLGYTTICRVLKYDKAERARPSRTGQPQLLTDARVDEIIEYLSDTWDNRCLDWTHLCTKLELPCTPETLATRLKQKGYFRCVACQKPYLTAAQVLARFFWSIAHIFWTVEWLKVLWSDEVTFLVGGRTVKQRVTRKRGERCCENCIQHQLHRGHTTPVNAWGAIGYGYKSPLIFLHGSGKSGAFVQTDYLAQVLKTQLTPILEAFGAITRLFAQLPSPYLWRMATQLTAISLHATAVPDGVQLTELS